MEENQRRIKLNNTTALRSSTYGTGQLIKEGISRASSDVSQIVLSLGGSATSDMGMGIAHALGVRLIDADGTDVAHLGGGKFRILFFLSLLCEYSSLYFLFKLIPTFIDGIGHTLPIRCSGRCCFYRYFEHASIV